MTLNSIRMLGIDEDKVNVNGGAVALGHPIGASGARILGSLVLELRRRGGGLGCAAICSGGGQGDAVIVEVERLAGDRTRHAVRGAAVEAATPTRQRAQRFFDLDRTLMEGSSAFQFGRAAYRAGLIRRRRLARRRVGEPRFRLRGSTDDGTDALRDRISARSLAGTRVGTCERLGADVLARRAAADLPADARGRLRAPGRGPAACTS